jgi:activator of HSP90 ATPase
MPATLLSRRALALNLGALPLGLSLASRVAAADSMASSPSVEGDGLIHSADAIHQQITFKSSRQKVYAALTTSEQFDAITRLSDGLELVTAPGAKPTSISRDVGGSFTLFGGYISGRNVELVHDQRLVQVWRAASWPAGEFSIVKFVLMAEGAGTRLLFDHRGFPQGEGGHLASGWHSHYWDPMTKFLSQA